MLIRTIGSAEYHHFIPIYYPMCTFFNSLRHAINTSYLIQIMCFLDRAEFLLISMLYPTDSSKQSLDSLPFSLQISQSVFQFIWHGRFFCQHLHHIYFCTGSKGTDPTASFRYPSWWLPTRIHLQFQEMAKNFPELCWDLAIFIIMQCK